jgi:hypothetical protein
LERQQIGFDFLASILLPRERSALHTTLTVKLVLARRELEFGSSQRLVRLGLALPPQDLGLCRAYTADHESQEAI